MTFFLENVKIKSKIYGNFKKQQTELKQVFFSKSENIRNHSPIKAMFLILKHVDKENSEYPAKADYPDLTKQK